MNKLISRNPVQRFKQGRKIVLKAQLGGYMFGKMGGWNRSMGNTITDQESLNYLKEMGLDGQNALQIQQYINQQFGKNSVKEDNKWGIQSRAGLKALYDNWKMQQKPQTPASPIGNSVIESQRALEEIPQLSQDQLMFNNINSKTFNAPLPPRTIPYDRSMTRDIIKDITGNSAYNFTGDQRKALRQYLNGEQYDQEAIKAFGDLKQYDKYMKWRLQKGGILPSRNIVERFKNGRKIDIFKDGGVKRYSVSHTDSKKTVYFDSEEQAKAYQKKQKSGTTVRRDSKKEASGQVLKVDRTKEKATQYGRQQLEKNNNLSFKQAYQAARKSGNKYFAYKGKVYKSDLENGKDNMTEMAQHYGNNLGYSGDPKLGTKKSMAARAQYRKDINTSEAGYTGEKKKFQAPYVSSYDGGELFSNFMGLASPTRWAGAVGRASRGEGNTGTFVGKVLNNMLDPQNGARENQGIFSSGLAPTDEQWAAEHPVISGVVNGALDAAVYGPKPKFNRDFKFKTNWGYNGRQFKTVKEEVPMGIFEGDLNISPGVSTGSNPYVQLGKQVGETTKTVTRRVMTNPGTKYVKSVTEKPTGKYNFSWSEGMKDMFPWIEANTFNRTMQQ